MEKGRGKKREGREGKGRKTFPLESRGATEGSSAFPLDRKCGDKKEKHCSEENDPGSVPLPGRKLPITLIAF